MAFNDLRTRKEVESSAVTERACVAEKVKGCLQEESDEKKKQAGKKRKIDLIYHSNPVLLRAFPLEKEKERKKGGEERKEGRKEKESSDVVISPTSITFLVPSQVCLPSTNQEGKER
ncbi:uncharacterized protein RSE6_09466 [Rhynchosporium secalis]|uniref:Uncharacterized protein n=1 Tax=Rhynchosporium secalis TaxID=38038 RepID=A0A1E1MI40_RHYSE|nr:uncharacterized protein RSE6_09466 [Rhynchosporium secalis]